jgi:phospholipase/carboxylesterase
VLHGLGDKPSHDWLQRVAVNPSVKVRMILPQAPLPFGEGGYGWFPYRAGNLDQVSLAQFVSAAADRVSQLVTTLAQQRPTTGRAVVCGFSQGAILTYALSLRHPDQIELAVPISGMLPAPLWPERGPGDLRFPSVLALHGTSDPVIRFGVDEQLVHRLHALGYRVELKAFTGVGHTMTPDMVELIRANISPALTQQTRTAARGAKPKAR